MGDNTHISWSDATWPVMRGCDKISPGCKLCWAIKDAHRMQHNPNPKIAAHFAGLTVIQGGKPNWSGVVRLDEAILEWPLKWSKPRDIFVASSGDLFHEAASDDDIDSVFAVMQHAQSRGHRFQVLTKRSERALIYLTNPALYGRLLTKLNWVRGRWPGLPTIACSDPLRFPMSHIKLGFSAENQKYFDERWMHMQHLAVRGWMVWCSYEPALGACDMSAALAAGLRWVVCGGESGGKDARPMHPGWARSVRDQCLFAGVPYHFKQRGEFTWDKPTLHKREWGTIDLDGNYFPFTTCWNGKTGAASSSGEIYVYRVGKASAGRLLDGVEWNEQSV